MITMTVSYNRLKVVREAIIETKQELYKTIREQGNDLLSKIRTAIRTSYKSKSGYRRSGKLLKSVVLVDAVQNAHESRIVISIGKDVPYANVQIGPPDQRTVIVPKNAKALAIPLNNTARMVQNEMGSLRGKTGLVRRGALLGRLTSTEIASGKEYITPMYALARRVVLSPIVDIGPIVDAQAAIYKSELKDRIMQRYGK